MTYTLTLPDGNQKKTEYKTYLEFVQNELPFLKNDAYAVKINDQILDLSREINSDSNIEILTFKQKEGWQIFQHSTAHLLGMAIQRIWKDALLTVGPVIENGPGFFYYDFYLKSEKITAEHFPKIEKEMSKIVESNYDIYREVYTKTQASKIFEEKGEIYKLKLLEKIPEDTVTIYGQGEWFDLCRGPHIPRTGLMKHFKLTAISGAYWLGDSQNEMLNRIYGVSFKTKKELDTYIFQIEEAKKRDHRKIGKEMDLFSFQEEAPGFPFWHPKGTVLWYELANYIQEECKKRNYKEIKTPMILSSNLWKTSGHWDNFKENMYFTEIDKEDFAVKPMNCPGCSLIYKHNLHSYRQLPLRYSELGLVHRHELSGVLHGLFRVRSFTQDDAHIYTPMEYLQQEVVDTIDFTFSLYKKFGFKEFKTYIATRPEKSLGSEHDWQKATDALQKSLETKKVDYEIKEGEGAFYGPKIEFNIKDSLSRLWQCGTIQIDFSMPVRFKLDYTASDGSKQRPVMIHRAIYGSIERFYWNFNRALCGQFSFMVITRTNKNFNCIPSY